MNKWGHFFFRAEGGVEAEKEERERWINKERQKITDSVEGKKTIIQNTIKGIKLSKDIEMPL